MANGLILPSAGRTPKMHIGVGIDTSGSISNVEINCMMNHVFTILQQFKDFTVDVWCCGSVVYPETFKRYTANNKKDLVNYVTKSDGGNDERENFKFIKEKYKHEKLDVFILLSDYFDPLDGDTETTSPCPCIFMCLDHPNFVPPSRIKAETYRIVSEQLKNDADR
jgi:predicted metal-dependent peptidase